MFNTDLDNYLKITAAQIRDSVAKYLDTDNRVLLEIVPAPQEAAPAAAPLAPGESKQPTAPPSQVPAEPAPGAPIPTHQQAEPAIESN